MSVIVPDGFRTAVNRISIRRIAVLVVFGAGAFVSGMVCQAHVDRQMPTVIIKPQFSPEQPVTEPSRQIITIT